MLGGEVPQLANQCKKKQTQEKKSVMRQQRQGFYKLAHKRHTPYSEKRKTHTQQSTGIYVLYTLHHVQWRIFTPILFVLYENWQHYVRHFMCGHHRRQKHIDIIQHDIMYTLLASYFANKDWILCWHCILYAQISPIFLNRSISVFAEEKPLNSNAICQMLQRRTTMRRLNSK